MNKILILLIPLFIKMQNLYTDKNLLIYDILKFDKRSISFLRNNRVHITNKVNTTKIGFFDVQEFKTKGNWTIDLEFKFEFDSKNIQSSFAILLGELYDTKFDSFNSNFNGISDYYHGPIIAGNIFSESEKDDSPIFSELIVNNVKNSEDLTINSLKKTGKICKTNFYHSKKFMIKLEYSNDNISVKIKEDTDENFILCNNLYFQNLNNFNISIGGQNTKIGTNLFLTSLKIDSISNELKLLETKKTNHERIFNLFKNFNEDSRLRRLELKKSLTNKYSEFLEFSPKDLIKNLNKDMKEGVYKYDYSLKVLNAQAESLDYLREHLINHHENMQKNENSFLNTLYNLLLDIEKSSDMDNSEINKIFKEIEGIGYEQKIDAVLSKTNLISKRLNVMKDFKNLVNNNVIDDDNLNKMDEKYTKIHNDLRNNFVKHSEDKMSKTKYFAIYLLYSMGIVILIGFLYIYYRLSKNKNNKGF